MNIKTAETKTVFGPDTRFADKILFTGPGLLQQSRSGGCNSFISARVPAQSSSPPAHVSQK